MRLLDPPELDQHPPSPEINLDPIRLADIRMSNLFSHDQVLRLFVSFVNLLQELARAAWNKVKDVNELFLKDNLSKLKNLIRGGIAEHLRANVNLNYATVCVNVM